MFTWSISCQWIIYSFFCRAVSHSLYWISDIVCRGTLEAEVNDFFPLEVGTFLLLSEYLVRGWVDLMRHWAGLRIFVAILPFIALQISNSSNGVSYYFVLSTRPGAPGGFFGPPVSLLAFSSPCGSTPQESFSRPQGWDLVNIPAPPLCGSQILLCV